MTAIAGAATLLVSTPNGFLVDRYGRKTSLVPWLLFLVVAADLR